MKTNLTLCSLFVICVATTCCSCERSPLEYIGEPTNHGSEHDAYLWITNQLKDAKSPDEVIQFLRGVSNETITFQEYGGSKWALVSVASELLELGDSSSTDCPQNSINLFLQIITNVYGGYNSLLQPESMSHDEALFSYLTKNVAGKMGVCLNKIRDTFPESQSRLGSKDEKVLDELIASMSKEDSSNIFERARSIDLVDGHLNARKMLSVAKQYRGSETKQKSSVVLTRFIAHQCNVLLSPMSFIFNTYSLARILNGALADAMVFPSDFYKLYEYNRICLQYIDQSSRDRAEANIKAQLRKAKHEVADKIVAGVKSVFHKM